MRSCGAPLKMHRDLSSYEAAASQSHGSPLCLLLGRSLKVPRGPVWRSAVYLEGSMAKIEYDEAKSLPGASLVASHSRGRRSDSRWMDSPPLQSSARRWWESVQLIPSGGCVAASIRPLN